METGTCRLVLGYIVMLVIIANSLIGAINIDPSYAVASGENVKLCCLTDTPTDTVDWMLTHKNGSELKTPIYLSSAGRIYKAFSERIEISDVGKVHHLEIKHVTLDDAGTYACREKADLVETTLSVVLCKVPYHEAACTCKDKTPVGEKCHISCSYPAWIASTLSLMIIELLLVLIVIHILRWKKVLNIEFIRKQSPIERQLQTNAFGAEESTLVCRPTGCSTSLDTMQHSLFSTTSWSAN